METTQLSRPSRVGDERSLVLSQTPSTQPAVPEADAAPVPPGGRRQRRPSSPLPSYRARPKSSGAVATPWPGSPQAERKDWHDRAYWIPSPPIIDRDERRSATEASESDWVFRPLSTKPRPTWSTRFHVTDSKANSANHHLRRRYFDALPNAKITFTPEFPLPRPRIPKSQRTLQNGNTTVSNAGAKEGDKTETSTSPKKSKATTANLLQRRVSALYNQFENHPNMKQFADFYRWCIDRFKNLARCWRLLDTSLNMNLTYLEFLNSLRDNDYKGDGRQIFKILDRDRSGSLSYFHFDPGGAKALAQLRVWAEGQFGGVQQAFVVFDKDRNGSLTFQEFSQGARQYGLTTEEPIYYLFQLIDLDKNKQITKEEVAFMDAWRCPPWLKVQADHEGLQAFKENLLRKYRDNLLLAWNNIDQNDQMRVSWEEFLAACKKLNFDEKRLPGVWRALDHNLSGWVSLHELSPDAYDILVKFKRWAHRKEGNINKLLIALDENQDGWVGRREFLRIKADLNLTDDEYHMLFHGLDSDGKGAIKISKLRFLDTWNIEEDIKDEEIWNCISQSLSLGNTADDEAMSPTSES